MGERQGRIHHRRAGSGPVVLLVHGYCTTGELTWESSGWTAGLEAAGFTVIVPDLRGHGRSQKPTRAADYSPESFTEDLAVLLDYEGVPAAHVIGHSMGADIAAEFERRFPERVRSLTLCSVGCADPFSTRDLDAERAYLLDGTPLLDSRTSRVIDAALRTPGSSPAAIAAIAAGMAGTRRITRPLAPALVLAGDRDDIAPDTVEFARRIEAPAVVVPGAGHFDILTDKHSLTAAIDFIREHE